MWTLFTFDCVISAADFRSGGKSNPTLGFQPAAPTCVQPPRPPPPPPPQRACFPVLSPPSLMGRPLAGSELRGAFISDPQVRPRCLSCQNSPIQHCAEFINAALTHTHTHYHTWAHTHTLSGKCMHTDARCKKCSPWDYCFLGSFQWHFEHECDIICLFSWFMEIPWTFALETGLSVLFLLSWMIKKNTSSQTKTYFTLI